VQVSCDVRTSGVLFHAVNTRARARVNVSSSIFGKGGMGSII
jgi:hypothetical protein